MLTVSPTAVQAVDALISRPEAPEGAGMRISRTGEESESPGELRLSLVPEPAEGDQLVPEAPVFVEPELAPVLDDKVLDADVSGEEVRFSLKDRAA